MDDTKKQIEIELKLKLEAFADYLKLVGALGNMDSEEKLVNCFFDSDDCKLSKAGFALRVRISDKIGLITVKGMGTVSGAAAIREETETTIDKLVALDLISEKEDLLKIACLPIKFVREQIGSAQIKPVVQFETVRQHKSYQIRDIVYEFEIDKTEYTDGSIDYELEVELADLKFIEQAELDLRRLFESLDIPFEFQADSKFARGLAAAKK